MNSVSERIHAAEHLRKRHYTHLSKANGMILRAANNSIAMHKHVQGVPPYR